MKNIEFFDKVRISITSIKEYKNLLKDSLSKAILYSVIFSLILGSILGVFNFIAVGTIENNMKDIISSEEFKFTFENGILDFENSPIKVDEGRSLVYIDTDTSLENIDSIRKILVHKDESVAILKDGVSYRISENQYNFKFSDLAINKKIDNEVVLKTLGVFKFVKYLAFFASILLTFINFMINALVLSVGGIILNKFNKLNLKYRDILKLCIYATTLSTILGVISAIGTFSLLISGVYLILAINYVKDEI